MWGLWDISKESFCILSVRDIIRTNLVSVVADVGKVVFLTMWVDLVGTTKKSEEWVARFRQLVNFLRCHIVTASVLMYLQNNSEETKRKPYHIFVKIVIEIPSFLS